MCTSKEVHTTGKVVNSANYWRCDKCGEVWNAGRRQSASRYDSNRSWGR
ncbi:MAG: hypothetical protein M3R55_08180 [Acidobacteriota bacterium]|nr:hypothetical protein [Acidobacteriota bacterium]